MHLQHIFTSRVLSLVVMVLALLAVGCKKEGAKESPRPVTTMDIIDTAISAGDFNTLVAAVKAADLVSTLKGPGPFTVFAPTDAAFEKLPAGTVQSLLLPENKQKLASVLTYHVVPGKVMAAEAAKLSSAKTVNGQSLSIKTAGGGVTIDEAKVIKTDILCSNGVIHVIDAVVLPK
jgi:uncharacterized surface protein with fasciclin (FAS1) repeats